MAKQHIEIDQTFDFPVARVFAFLSEHENLAAIFKPARIKRLTNGQGTRNGVGSVRELRILLAPPFVETVTAYRENELIEYRITEGSPLKNHKGTMRFRPVDNGPGKGTGTHLHYAIEFEGKLPLMGALIRPGLEAAIRRGLKGMRC